MKMTKTEICIGWNEYLNHVSKGFSCLQQNSEFVDMTLAAEGHLVKVHRSIVALASPYLRAMLQSAPCQHPVIFLNNVNHKILGYILEYIYTGEVKIPTDTIDTFIAACKSLCIRGVDSIASSEILSENQTKPEFKSIEKPPVNNFAAHITINEKDNNYDFELISNQNNVISQNDEAMLPTMVPVTSFNDSSGQMETEICSSIVNEFETTQEKDIDISNIHNFIILKQKTNNNFELSTNKTEDAIRILSDETVVSSDLKTQSSLIESSKEIKKCSGDVELDINAWHIDSNQNPTTIDLSAKPNLQPVNISLSTHNSEIEPTQDISDIHRDKMESILTKTVKKTLTKKHKNIFSYVKDINLSEDRAQTNYNKSVIMEMDKVTHYTVSSRGALQLMLHSYLYNAHHHSNLGQKIRWRCIDYRKMHCPAYIDTDKEEVTAVSANHCHPLHNDQIRKKIKSKLVFTSLSNAANAIDDYLKENPK